MRKWLRELFWKRCFYCKEKKQWFFYMWEVPGVNTKGMTNEELEICTNCAEKKVEEINNKRLKNTD